MGPRMNRSNLATVSSGVFTTGPLGGSVGMLKSPFEFGPSCHGRSLNHQFLTQRALFPASICDPYVPEAEDDGDDGDWNICWDFERNDWGLILKSLILGGSEFEKLSLFRVGIGGMTSVEDRWQTRKNECTVEWHGMAFVGMISSDVTASFKWERKHSTSLALGSGWKSASASSWGPTGGKLPIGTFP